MSLIINNSKIIVSRINKQTLKKIEKELLNESSLRKLSKLVTRKILSLY